MKFGSLISIGVGAVTSYYLYSSLKQWINKAPKFRYNKALIRSKWYSGYELLGNWMPCEESNIPQCAEQFTRDYPKGLQVLAKKCFYWIESIPIGSQEFTDRKKTFSKFLELNQAEAKYFLNYFEEELGVNFYTAISEEWTLDETIKKPILQKVENLYQITKLLKTGVVVAGGGLVAYGTYKFSQRQGWLK